MITFEEALFSPDKTNFRLYYSFYPEFTKRKLVRYFLKRLRNQIPKNIMWIDDPLKGTESYHTDEDIIHIYSYYREDILDAKQTKTTLTWFLDNKLCFLEFMIEVEYNLSYIRIVLNGCKKHCSMLKSYASYATIAEELANLYLGNL